MKNYFDFTEKKYLVTGASSGIGRATAVCLSNQGAKVVIIGRNEVRLAETLNMMSGEKHMSIAMDLCEDVDISELFKKVNSDGEKIDGIVHCAGTTITAPIGTVSKKKFDEMMTLNVYVLMELGKYFCKKKNNNGNGSIVAVSSLTAVDPGKCQSAYAAAKAGMNAAIQSAAQELACKNIRINSVMPAMTRTQMYYDTIDEIGEDALNKLTDQQLLGVPEPEQIAESIMFLLSDASSAITGRAMYVDAGTF